MSDNIVSERLDRVALVTLNRPERLNALNANLLDELAEILAGLAADDEVCCLVLTGQGRAFSAGGDISQMASGERPATTEEPVARLRRQEESSLLLHEMGKPTIAMVNGVAAGAGLSLAAACDLRFAAESSRFGTAFVRVGFSGDFGGAYTIQSLVGQSRAKELYYSGRIIDSAEALAIGLVSRVLPDAELRQETLAFAARLAAGPTIALRMMKENLNLAPRGNLSDTLDREAKGMIFTGGTNDHREAARAFLEKREPTFSGR